MDKQLKNEIKELVWGKFNKIFSGKDFQQKLGLKRKEDFSIVTDIDTYICEIINDKLANLPQFKNYCYLSEENHNKLSFPAIILDPVDGTRELAKGIPECALSLAIIHEDGSSWSWIYNPFTGFDLDSDDLFNPGQHFDEENLMGFVSRSEWKKGIYQQLPGHSMVRPLGSIAFKLGLLASGSCDFVITLRPKNIWDIAAGTYLCADRGIKLFTTHGEVQKLSEIRYQTPLFWCRPNLESIIRKQFQV